MPRWHARELRRRTLFLLHTSGFRDLAFVSWESEYLYANIMLVVTPSPMHLHSSYLNEACASCNAFENRIRKISRMGILLGWFSKTGLEVSLFMLDPWGLASSTACDRGHEPRLRGHLRPTHLRQVRAEGAGSI